MMFKIRIFHVCKSVMIMTMTANPISTPYPKNGKRWPAKTSPTPTKKKKNKKKRKKKTKNRKKSITHGQDGCRKNTTKPPRKFKN